MTYSAEGETPLLFHDGRVTLHGGDCLDVLKTLPEASVDSVVTDPPYGLKFMGRAWDATKNIAFRPELWAEVLRVLKPGGCLLAMGGTRTYHRMVCAIEDAGFEVRDCLMWVHGQGFPKNHNQLKPAHEPIVFARKPLSEGSVADNVLRHGTGALNIDGCRIATDPAVDDPRLGGKGDWSTDKMAANVYEGGYAGVRVGSSPLGRWPANLIHDGSPEVLAGFPESAGGAYPASGAGFGYSGGERKQSGVRSEMSDSGSAARFFYCAKASKRDRAGSKHPTVKPINLLQYLVRLVTPLNGVVLDCFAGTGTTGEAAFREGFRAILIEREPEYQADIVRRLEALSDLNAPSSSPKKHSEPVCDLFG